MAWPSVWADQIAGASRRTPKPAARAIARQRSGASAQSAIAAPAEPITISGTSQPSSVALLEITTSSVIAPAPIAPAPRIRPGRAAERAWAKVAPASAAANGASSET